MSDETHDQRQPATSSARGSSEKTGKPRATDSVAVHMVRPAEPIEPLTRPREAGLPQRMFIVLNPFSGNGSSKSMLKKVRPLLEGAGAILTIKETEHARHCIELVRELDADQFDAVVGVGGDGTFHEMVQGMLSRPNDKHLPMCLIPGGTGNAFLQTIGLREPKLAVEALLRGSTKGIDCIRVEHGYNSENKEAQGEVFMFNMLGYGLTGDTGVRAEKMRFLSTFRYTAAGVIEALRKKERIARITIDGSHVIEGPLTILIAMLTTLTGTDMLMAPFAKVDDSLLDLVLVREVGRLKLLQMLTQLKKGEHVRNSAVEYWHCRELLVEPLNEQEEIFIDGEATEATTPLRLSMMHHALQFFR